MIVLKVGFQITLIVFQSTDFKGQKETLWLIWNDLKDRKNERKAIAQWKKDLWVNVLGILWDIYTLSFTLSGFHEYSQSSSSCLAFGSLCVFADFLRKDQSLLPEVSLSRVLPQ